jgi:hypothetical protein
MRLTLVKVLDALGIFTRTPSPVLFLKLLMQATMRKFKSFFAQKGIETSGFFQWKQTVEFNDFT